MILLDTDVLLDCLRGADAALAWLRIEASEEFGIPGVVAMELLGGCRDQTDVRKLQQLLSRYQVVWPEAFEFAQGFELLATHRVASGIGIPDCLIAAMALARGATLYTFNSKRFQVITGLDVRQPYQRA